MRLVSLPETWRQRAIVITDVDDPERWFTDEELRVARGFPLARRQAEWMLSRIAAKELARRLGISADPKRCFVDRPRLLVDGAPSRFVSLSHSVGFAGAALDEQPVGIDVEKPRDLAESAAHLFLNEGEEATMRRCRIDDRLIHFWAAKEAIYKQHQGEFQTLKRVPLQLIDASENGLRFDGVETLRVVPASAGGSDLIAALTLPTS